MKDKHIIQEDEIDLKEVFSLLWAKKVFIILFTSIVMIGGISFNLINKPQPIYEGTVLIEIGEIQSEIFGSETLDKVDNLIPILQNKGITAYTPRKSDRLLYLKFSSPNREKIYTNLQKTIDYLLSRNQEKANFHKNVIMTQQISDISVLEEPINVPKLQNIILIWFISGVVLSIFIVLLIKFIQTVKSKEV